MLPLRRIIIERSIRPEILDFLSSDEVLELFDIYFDFINLQIPVLDRTFHTPGLVASRSPFLLTTGELLTSPLELLGSFADFACLRVSVLGGIQVLPQTTGAVWAAEHLRAQARVRDARSRLQERRDRAVVPDPDVLRFAGRAIRAGPSGESTLFFAAFKS